jgi:hypothetical protein
MDRYSQISSSLVFRSLLLTRIYPDSKPFRTRSISLYATLADAFFDLLSNLILIITGHLSRAQRSFVYPGIVCLFVCSFVQLVLNIGNF